MRARLGSLALVLTIACSDTTEPTAPSVLLTGRWAADDVGFVALRSAAELDLVCGYVAIDQGILLDANGRFEVSGVLRHYSGRFRVALRGERAGDLLLLELAGPEQFARSFELIAGADPVEPRVPSCPQPAPAVR